MVTFAKKMLTGGFYFKKEFLPAQVLLNQVSLGKNEGVKHAVLYHLCDV